MANPYEMMMNPNAISPEERMAAAQQYQRQGATGAYLANSTLKPTAAQGGLMQKQAARQAEAQGLMEMRKSFNDQTLQLGLRRAAAAAGGETDPAYNRLGRGDRESVTGNAQTAKGFMHIAENWNPEMQIPVIGGLTSAVDKYGIGNPFSERDDKANQYWSEYENWAADVRKNLFGSALTGYELKAWEKANVNSKMQPDDVRRHFNVRQQVIVKKAIDDVLLKRSMGHPIETLREAYAGVIPEELWNAGSEEELKNNLRAFRTQTRENYTKFLNGSDISQLSDEELDAQLAE